MIKKNTKLLYNIFKAISISFLFRLHLVPVVRSETFINISNKEYKIRSFYHM